MRRGASPPTSPSCPTYWEREADGFGTGAPTCGHSANLPAHTNSGRSRLLGDGTHETRREHRTHQPPQSELFEPFRTSFAFGCEINNRISQSSSGCLLIAVKPACDDRLPDRIECSFEDGKHFRTKAFAITTEGHGALHVGILIVPTSACFL